MTVQMTIFFCVTCDAWPTLRDSDSVDVVVVGVVRASHFWFPINTFWRGASISFKFTKGLSIFKYYSSSKREVIRKMLLWPFLARLHEVQGTVVVTTGVRVRVPFPSQCIKVFWNSISWQPLVRKHSYLHHRACLIRQFGIHRVMFLNQVIFLVWCCVLW